MSLFPARKAESFDFKEVQYEKRDWVAQVTINRPHNYNAYSTPALQELASAFEDASWDDSVAVVVYTGTGDRAFCTGGDVKEYQENYTQKPRDYWKYMCCFKGYIESMVNCAKPVIARLNGMAVGGGNESQLACDLAVMGEHTFIAQVGTGVGSVACGGSTQWLPLHVGDRKARGILLLNQRYPAYTSLAMGLVNVVVPTVRGRTASSARGSPATGRILPTGTPTRGRTRSRAAQPRTRSRRHRRARMAIRSTCRAWTRWWRICATRSSTSSLSARVTPRRR